MVSNIYTVNGTECAEVPLRNYIHCHSLTPRVDARDFVQQMQQLTPRTVAMVTADIVLAIRLNTSVSLTVLWLLHSRLDWPVLLHLSPTDTDCYLHRVLLAAVLLSM